MSTGTGWTGQPRAAAPWRRTFPWRTTGTGGRGSVALAAFLTARRERLVRVVERAVQRILGLRVPANVLDPLLEVLEFFVGFRKILLGHH